MSTGISLDHIREAAAVIDPVFRDTPQYVSDAISGDYGVTTILKVECVNPIRSFKGRGTDYLLHRMGPHSGGYVCASAGNFGQGMAFAARKRSYRMTVFAATNANEFKVERMRALGAEVVLSGNDFDAAKEVAIRHAEETGSFYVEDGVLSAIAEGAGTIALELTQTSEALDAVLVPLGNGALINGIGTWLRRASPHTRVIGVCAAGAPSMEISWRAGKPINTGSTSTIADGIAVRIPVPEALALMRETVDDVTLVTDEQILKAMQLLLVEEGFAAEPAGAAGLAALANMCDDLAGQRVAIVITGGNVTEEQLRRCVG